MDEKKPKKEEEIKQFEDLENRVGFKALLMLHNELQDYVQKHVVDEKFVGDPHYKRFYEHLTEYFMAEQERLKIPPKPKQRY